MSTSQRTKRIVIVMFDGVEELDAIGPWEVFAAWCQHWPEDGWKVHLASPTGSSVTCGKGLEVGVHQNWGTVKHADLIIVPGGDGARAASKDPQMVGTVATWPTGTNTLASVCTGAFLLAAAGLLSGQRATTYHRARQDLQAIDPSIDISTDRVVDSGSVVTSAGISAGIDMALYLVHRFAPAGRAQDVADYIEYDYWTEPTE